MPLLVISFASYLTQVYERWSDDDFNASFVIKALKGRSFRGSCRVWIGKRRVSIPSGDQDAARRWFASVASDFINQLNEPELTPLALIPVPNSKAVDHSVPCDVTKQADALAELVPGSFVYDIVRWARPMASSSGEDGSRDPREFYETARVKLPNPPRQFSTAILIDDVCTTGAHLRGVNARLSIKHGVDVAAALCAGYTPAPNASAPRPVFTEHHQDLDDWSP